MVKSKGPRFRRPTVYDIDGWEFAQHLCLRVFEREWLLRKQKERNNSARDFVALAQQIAKDKELKLNAAIALLSDAESGEELLPYALEIEQLESKRPNDDMHDGVSLILRTRLNYKWVRTYQKDLAEQGIIITDEELDDAELVPELDRLDDSITKVIAEEIIQGLPSPVYFKIAEFLDMENSGVATPDELERGEGAEDASPKTSEPS